jgi:hypothetical protein
LAQQNHQGKIHIISHASRQLKENEKNYTRFLLETATSNNLDRAPGKTILSLTDCSRNFCKLAVIPDSGLDSTVSAIYHYWCQPYGLPETIVFNQGKVQTSRLESRINVLTPPGKTVNCRSNTEAFNKEVEQQWRNNQNDLSPEEFALHWNSLCNLQNPAKAKTLGNDQELTEVEDLDEAEVGTKDDFDQLPLMNDQQLHHLRKGNRSAYVGTNFKDEPTIDSETRKWPQNKLCDYKWKK